MRINYGRLLPLSPSNLGFEPPWLHKGHKPSVEARGYCFKFLPINFRRKQRKEIDNLRELRAQLDAGRAVTNQALLRSLSLPLRETNVAIRSRDVLDLRWQFNWLFGRLNHGQNHFTVLGHDQAWKSPCEG